MLEISIIGSFATGLWSKESDIDIGFTNYSETSINIEKTLEQIHNKLIR